MKNVLILRGLPASGKSTYARSLLASEPNRWVRINRDDIRAMASTRGAPLFESFAWEMKRHGLRIALEADKDVILDDTHLNEKHLRDVHKWLAEIGDVRVEEVPFNASIEDCVRRDADRPDATRVGENAIRAMAHGAKLDSGRVLLLRVVHHPSHVAGITVNNDHSLPDAVICDIDGTLAITGDRSPYDVARSMFVDEPNKPVVDILLAMLRAQKNIVFITGRSEKYRAETCEFIERCLRVASDVEGVYELHMRRYGDDRPDFIVKRDAYVEHVQRRYHVDFVLDDSPRCCAIYRALRLTCLQL